MTNHYEIIENNLILNKSFNFAVEMIKFCKEFRNRTHEYSLADQILRSSTSIGANANEAVVSMSSKEFICKMNISLKEAYETRYWMLLFMKTGYLVKNEEYLLDDLDELIRILVKIVKTTNSNVIDKRNK